MRGRGPAASGRPRRPAPALRRRFVSARPRAPCARPPARCAAAPTPARRAPAAPALEPGGRRASGCSAASPPGRRSVHAAPKVSAALPPSAPWRGECRRPAGWLRGAEGGPAGASGHRRERGSWGAPHTTFAVTARGEVEQPAGRCAEAALGGCGGRLHPVPHRSGQRHLSEFFSHPRGKYFLSAYCGATRLLGSGDSVVSSTSPCGQSGDNSSSPKGQTARVSSPQ